MENLDNMGAKSLEALSRDNLTNEGRKKLTVDILCGAATLASGIMKAVERMEK